MSEQCKASHAKLLAGRCPWCGRYIVAGEVEKSSDISSALSHGVRIDGRTLQQLVEEVGVLSYHAVVIVLKRVATQLSEFHRSRGLHGGLSPSQLLLVGGDVFISQETSSFLDDRISGGAARVPDVRGVADYLAPEQALSSQRSDVRADIYSLGCILYFLLIGRPPFPEGSLSERLLRHQTEVPPSIRANRPDAPLKLLYICEKMMAKIPQERYQSVDELLSDLETYD